MDSVGVKGKNKEIKNYVLNNLPFIEFIITSASDDAGKDRKTHMERASEDNRNFLKLIVPKIFSLPHNLTHIHVEHSCFIWGKNNHTLFKRRIFFTFALEDFFNSCPGTGDENQILADKEALSCPTF